MRKPVASEIKWGLVFKFLFNFYGEKSVKDEECVPLKQLSLFFFCRPGLSYLKAMS